MSRRGWLLFVALGIIWGVPYLLIKVAVADIHPLVVVFGRTLVGGLLLLPVALHQRALTVAVLRRWKAVLLYTLVEISGPWLMLGYGETRLTSSTSGLLVAVVPLVATVILVAGGDERFDSRRLAGLGVGLAGVVCLVGLDVHLDDMVGVGAVMLTVLGYAYAPVVISRRLSDLPTIGVVTATLILATVIYAPFVGWLWPSHVSAASAWSVVSLGVVCTGVAFVAFFALIAEVGPGRATVITYVNPAVAIVLGVLVLSEPFTAGMAVGFPLVIVGSVLATVRSRRTAPATATEPSDQDPSPLSEPVTTSH
ncbi:MAG TPA: DMT family transporter [Mycobacteriales bacterium]